MIQIQNLSVRYGDTSILTDCSLDIPKGAHIALMGPSGCGKTTLVHAIMGLIKYDGKIAVDGKISCLFQEPRLLPWLTAAENVNIVLGDTADTMPNALEYLQRVGLGDAASKRPGELSGGMQQRCALARALAYGGDILILDEPLKGLDEERKAEMRRLILQECAGKTLLLVTHEKEEAEALCEKIYHFENGNFQS